MSRTLPSPRFLITGGAVAVASVAYAVGTQVSGGTAGAATKPTARSPVRHAGAPVGAPGPEGRRGPGRHGGGRFLAPAAAALGVTEAHLRAALRDLRPEGARGDRRDELAATLATALGVDQAKVADALDAQRPAPGPGRRPDRGARLDALAKELGLTPAKVRAAFRAVRPERRAQMGSADGRDAFLTALAHELGVAKDKLATALGTVGPGPGGHPGHRGGPGHPERPGGHPGLDAAALAKAIGVDEAKVTAALADGRAAEQKAHAAEQATFAKRLADKLGVPESKVIQVLGSFERGPGRP